MSNSSDSSVRHRVLVVDDEPDITGLVSYHLVRAGYRVSTAGNGAEALGAATNELPDLIVLDLMLPGMSGHEVLRELRSRPETADVGVIFLTAGKEDSDRIEGMTNGADDYMVKPFAPQELVLRVGAVLRRRQSPSIRSGSMLQAGPVAIDRGIHRATLNGEELALTAIEYRLLVTLVQGEGRVQSRGQLLETVWNAKPDNQTRTVDMHVQRLRTKLRDAAQHIETVRGFGYRFRETVDGG